MSGGAARRLGMVLKGYPRLSETFISGEILLLEEQGFEVHIFSMRPPREAARHASVERIRARVTYLPEYLLPGLPRLLWHNLLLLLRMPGRYLRGVRLLLSRFGRAKKKHTWLKHFLQAGLLVQTCRTDETISHFHAHFAHTPTSVAMYAALLSGVPLSFTAHAKDIYTQDEDALAEKMARARFVLTCTGYNERHLKRLARERGLNTPVHCVYHGIDLSLFSPPGGSNPPRIAPEPPYRILSVARLVEKKGLPDVFAALALLQAEGLDFRYELIGEGEDRDKLEALARELGIAERVRLLGALAHEAVIERFRASHAFVLGCRIAENGDRDGIPNVVAESMALGVPVAATDVSGIPELVEDGTTGLTCPPGDPAALAAILRGLLTDAALRARVIPAAREKVERVFDNRTLILRIADIYRNAGLTPTKSGHAREENDAATGTAQGMTTGGPEA